MFLGFKFMLSGTGKLITLVDPGSVKRERKKLKKMARLYRRGKMQKYKIYECHRCWKNHAGKGNSFNLIIRMDNFVKSLMKEV